MCFPPGDCTVHDLHHFSIHYSHHTHHVLQWQPTVNFSQLILHTHVNSIHWINTHSIILMFTFYLHQRGTPREIWIGISHPLSLTLNTLHTSLRNMTKPYRWKIQEVKQPTIHLHPFQWWFPITLFKGYSDEYTPSLTSNLTF